MVEITLKKWNSIPDKRKGIWSEGMSIIPAEYVGKRHIEARYIVKGGGRALMTEDIHFKITQKDGSL